MFASMSNSEKVAVFTRATLLEVEQNIIKKIDETIVYFKNASEEKSVA